MADFLWDYTRDQWEEAAFRIADHTGSPPIDWQGIKRVVLHYSGVSDRPDGDPDELPWFTHVSTMLRRDQRYYVQQRGYSLGYNAVGPQNGKSWQVRGQDFMCAANRGFNTTSVAYQIPVDGDDPATDLVIQEVKRFVRWCERQAGRKLEVVGHRDVGQTTCRGNGIYAQIKAGVFNPDQEEDMDILTPPVRVYDSRVTGGKLNAGETRRIQTGFRGKGIYCNLTVAEPEGPGFISAWGGGVRPDVSNVNYSGNDPAVANTALVPLDTDGTIQVFLLDPSAPVGAPAE